MITSKDIRNFNIGVCGYEYGAGCVCLENIHFNNDLSHQKDKTAIADEPGECKFIVKNTLEFYTEFDKFCSNENFKFHYKF